ncbi:MAG TPA: flagellin [Rhizomicrobium sp.]|nr:flagellin [Rhizomicrobium sp.]
MLSVNTNTDAMVALEYLNKTQGTLAQTENAVSTGLTVATAKDNGAIFAIAQNMRGDVAGYKAVTQSLENCSSTVDVALSAGQSISDLLIQMKQQVLAAADTSLGTTSRQALNANFQALLQQITTVVQNAKFNGANLINGSTNQIEALASSDGQHRITVQAQNMTLSGPIVTISAAASISTQAQASAMIDTLQQSLNNVDSALASLGSGSAKFSIQASFVQNLSDTLTTGIGNLVDANMATESAQLTALQTKQQLGVQALSIANQAPQIILSLFH